MSNNVATAWFDVIGRTAELTPKGWLAKWGDARAVVTQTEIAALNAALGMTVAPDLAILDQVATTVGEFGKPWSIIVREAAGDRVADLAARHGLTKRSGLPLMACAARDAQLGGAQRNRLIRQVGSTASAAYTDTLTAGFEVTDGAFGSLMGGTVLDAANVTGYLAELSGRPVGTALGVLDDRMVCILNIAVVPEARRLGLGRSLTARAMADGFAAGADTAFLQTSDAGRPLYESIGFRVVETLTMFTA